MRDIIKVLEVSKTYSKKKILDKISFNIKEGSFTALIGCNGEGKSTSLRILAGIEDREGQVEYKGQDPFHIDSKIGNDIFLIHENLPMNFPLSLKDFISVYHETFQGWDESQFQRHIQNRNVDLKFNYQALSRGQKMQFVLSMALSSGAKLILCDEITSVLDFDAQFYFLEELKAFTRTGGTVVMTTNILNELESYADHVILLQNSKVILDSAINDIAHNYKVLKRTCDHELFNHKCVFDIRSRDGHEQLFITETSFLQGHDCEGLIAPLVPKLEEVLLFHIKKMKVKNEILVA
jgi:ABC-2 type transport system ATP-binding protein